MDKNTFKNELINVIKETETEHDRLAILSKHVDHLLTDMGSDKVDQERAQKFGELSDTVGLKVERLGVLSDFLEKLAQDVNEHAEWSKNGVLIGMGNQLTNTVEFLKTELGELDRGLTQIEKRGNDND
ncbi:NAD-dependent malic enzyme [Fructobacillus pseudoficulneus]|uniref:NAD-dependent malic enzyme n=1 Tax=Fructobacillus pseudoficulneus TaxID=220714 RepID=A0A3F3GVJ2_9LACO|nr:hypothetical protein [Fructobacillus pseudoficulneus]GAP03371.1 NAD-dependent malic enzyme [Fructobacillus pseudoficulneus]SEH43699.1 hypothetical protein SAMN05660469_1060 [Fructobacillus pseudoficulneus]